jgi:hypothetical protein
MPVADTSAVDACRKAAEDFANAQVNKRKRKAGEIVDDDDDAAKKPRTASPVTTPADSDDEDGDDVAAEAAHGAAATPQRPEDVSHRKYQKRLQKNRYSAFVSRIRRREYTRILEESLAEKDAAAAHYASAYSSVRAEYDNVCAELAALKAAAKARAIDIGRAVVRPVGEAASNTSSTAVVSMFMLAVMFGIMLPDMRQSANLSSSTTTAAASAAAAAAAAMSASASVTAAAVHACGANNHHHKPLQKYENQCLSPLAIQNLFASTAPSPPTSSAVSHLSSPPFAAPESTAVKDEPSLADPIHILDLDDPDRNADGQPISVSAVASASSSVGKIWVVPTGVDSDRQDAISEPGSACPTMVDMDGDLVLGDECNPTARNRALLAQLEANSSRIFSPADARAVVSLVKRKVDDGVLSHESLAHIAKSSSASPASTSPSSSSSSVCSDYGHDGSLRASVKAELEVEPMYGDSDDSGKERPVDLTVPQSFATVLHRLSAVADVNRFTAEIGAFIAYRLVQTEKGGSTKPVV